MLVTVLETAPELKAQVRKEVNSAVMADVALAALPRGSSWEEPHVVPAPLEELTGSLPLEDLRSLTEHLCCLT